MVKTKMFSFYCEGGHDITFNQFIPTVSFQHISFGWKENFKLACILFEYFRWSTNGTVAQFLSMTTRHSALDWLNFGELFFLLEIIFWTFWFFQLTASLVKIPCHCPIPILSSNSPTSITYDSDPCRVCNKLFCRFVCIYCNILNKFLSKTSFFTGSEKNVG